MMPANECGYAIWRNNLRFRELLDNATNALEAGEDLHAATIAQAAAHFAWNNSTGLMASPVLESLLMAIAERRIPALDGKDARPPTTDPKNILHVLTQAYAIGGHTRLVLQWIEKDRGRNHGIAITQQGSVPLPEWLHKKRQKSLGNVVNLEESAGTLLERARDLRVLSNGYDVVVLHVHPFDAVPIMAFAPHACRARVLVLNHASHTFWLGASIGHAYAEPYEVHKQISVARRGIEASRSVTMRIPIAKPDRTITRSHARRGWSIPDDAVVIFSCGSPYKYNPIDGTDFRELVREPLASHPNLYLLMAGPSGTPYWEELERSAPGRVRLLGPIPEQLMHAAFQAADIYLDSAPVSSGTATLEAASHGLPILSYAAEAWRQAGLSIGPADGLVPDAALFTSRDAFSKQLDELIRHPEIRATEGKRQAERIFDECIGPRWIAALEAIYKFVMTTPPPPSPAMQDMAQVGPIDICLQKISDADTAGNATKALASVSDDKHGDDNAITDIHGFKTCLGELRDLHYPAHLAPFISEIELSLYEDRLSVHGNNPTIEVIVTASELHTRLLDTMDSLSAQSYKSFSTTLVSPEEFDPACIGLPVATFVRKNPLAAINEAISESNADWILFLASGDCLFPDSLLAVATAITGNEGARIAYTDELACSGGIRRNSFDQFKPDFNLSLIRSAPYLGGMLMIERRLFTEIQGFSSDKEGSEEYDLALRALEACGPQAFLHIPRLLVWRDYSDRIGADASIETRSKRVRESLHEHFHRAGISADVDECATPGTFRVRYRHPTTPIVSIVIPSRDNPAMLRRCIEELLAKTDYAHYEILVVDNGSRNPETLALLAGLRTIAPERIRVIDYPHPFNFSAINNLAAQEAKGEYLLLLNDDTVALHEDWLGTMMGLAQQPDVGIVGCRLVLPSGRIQHAGIILGLNGVADFPWIGAAIDTTGYTHRLQLDQDVSAVTGACLLVRRSVFDEVGGMDEEHLKVAYGDFDLCLKVRQRGYRIVWTPHATLMHDVGTTLKQALKDPQAAAREQARFEAEQEVFYLRWHKQLARDPAYNPNLSLSSRKFESELNPELARDPIDWHPLPNIAALPGDLHGSGHYRVIQPAQGTHDTGLTRSRVLHGYPHPVVFERLETDILFTQRQVDDEQIAAVERMKRLTNCKIVMDFDDLLTHVPDYSIHKKTVWKDMAQRLERLCRSVDRITVSTKPLAEHMRKYHGDIHVVPNSLAPKLWGGLRSERRRSRKPRVGWVGGSAHAGDLALIRDVVRKLAEEVDWVFMGLYLQEMKPYLTEIHVGVPFEQYPAKMASLNLDLALAPLEINPFNECKSNLRILEYGILGIPAIVTDITPYQGDFPVTRVKNRPQDWIQAIREHVADPDEMERRGQALRQKIMDEWMIDRHLDAWIKAWTL